MYKTEQTAGGELTQTKQRHSLFDTDHTEMEETFFKNKHSEDIAQEKHFTSGKNFHHRHVTS